jgi:integrase
MLSGCRACEVIQLLTTDVRKIDGIWFMDLVGSGHCRHLKNRESIRKVPIYSALVAAGVIDWWREQRGPRLFPLLFPYAGIKTTQWFSAMLKQIKVKRPAVTLHSLCHTLTQKLARARTFPPLQRRLLGHSIGTARPRRECTWVPYSVTELSEALEKVTWPKIV